LAVRASGKKLGEIPDPDNGGQPHQSLAHSAAIYVTLEGTPALGAHPRAKEVARQWIARLEKLEGRLAEDKIQDLANEPNCLDGVDIDHLRKNRSALLKAIQAAKGHFMAQAR
jgi:hypothetical protein